MPEIWPPTRASNAWWRANVRRRMSNRRSVEGEYRVEGGVLDELGLDRQAVFELKLKVGLHQKILQLVKRKGRIKFKGVGQSLP
jgi:hypothetical protein